jgi:hypothetical protein
VAGTVRNHIGRRHATELQQHALAARPDGETFVSAVRRDGGETRRRWDAAAERRGGGVARWRRDAVAELPLLYPGPFLARQRTDVLPAAIGQGH